MNLLGEIEGDVVSGIEAVAVQGVAALVKLAWDKATGGDVGGDEAAIAALAKHTAAVAAASALAEARRLAELAQAELVAEFSALADKADAFLASLAPSSKPLGLEPLGLDIQVVSTLPEPEPGFTRYVEGKFDPEPSE